MPKSEKINRIMVEVHNIDGEKTTNKLQLRLTLIHKLEMLLYKSNVNDKNDKKKDTTKWLIKDRSKIGLLFLICYRIEKLDVLWFNFKQLIEILYQYIEDFLLFFHCFLQLQESDRLGMNRIQIYPQA
jgi:hypothetical protein